VPISKQQKRQTLEAFIANLLGLQQAAIQQSQIFGTPQDVPRFNFNELIEDSADGFSIKDFTKYLMPTTGLRGASGGATPVAGAPMADRSGAEQEQAQSMGMM